MQMPIVKIFLEGWVAKSLARQINSWYPSKVINGSHKQRSDQQTPTIKYLKRFFCQQICFIRPKYRRVGNTGNNGRSCIVCLAISPCSHLTLLNPLPFAPQKSPLFQRSQWWLWWWLEWVALFILGGRHVFVIPLRLHFLCNAYFTSFLLGWCYGVAGSVVEPDPKHFLVNPNTYFFLWKLGPYISLLKEIDSYFAAF